MDLFFFRRKTRHRIAEFPHFTLRVELFRLRTARNTFAYELHLFERKKRDFERVGVFRLEDSAKLVKLINDANNYVNGLTS